MPHKVARGQFRGGGGVVGVGCMDGWGKNERSRTNSPHTLCIMYEHNMGRGEGGAIGEMEPNNKGRVARANELKFLSGEL